MFVGGLLVAHTRRNFSRCSASRNKETQSKVAPANVKLGGFAAGAAGAAGVEGDELAVGADGALRARAPERAGVASVGGVLFGLVEEFFGADGTADLSGGDEDVEAWRSGRFQHGVTPS